MFPTDSHFNLRPSKPVRSGKKKVTQTTIERRFKQLVTALHHCKRHPGYTDYQVSYGSKFSKKMRNLGHSYVGRVVNEYGVLNSIYARKISCSFDTSVDSYYDLLRYAHAWCLVPKFQYATVGWSAKHNDGLPAVLWLMDDASWFMNQNKADQLDLKVRRYSRSPLNITEDSVTFGIMRLTPAGQEDGIVVGTYRPIYRVGSICRRPLEKRVYFQGGYFSSLIVANVPENQSQSVLNDPSLRGYIYMEMGEDYKIHDCGIQLVIPK